MPLIKDNIGSKGKGKGAKGRGRRKGGRDGERVGRNGGKGRQKKESILQSG